MILYVATSNPGKLRDFATAAQTSTQPRSQNPGQNPGQNPTIELLPLPNLDAIPPPEETESTFAGNAALKALFYSRHAPGLIVLADDSGLEVDALGGAPGVRSARFADDHATQAITPPPPSGPISGADPDLRNNQLLLLKLTHFPPEQRHARYRCVLVAARDRVVLATAHGTVEGQILSTPRGTSGFGYDPLFYLPDLDRTMAELDPLTRLSLSHRGRALRNLLPDLQP